MKAGKTFTMFPYHTIQNRKTRAKNDLLPKSDALDPTTEKNKPLQLTLTKGAPLA